MYVCQELEKARAMIAARLASKDSNVIDPASATASSSVNAMSLIAQRYVSDSEEEEGEIEYSRVKQIEKKAKLQKAVFAVEDTGHLSLTASVSQASNVSVQEASASLPADGLSTDNHSQHHAAKSESRSSDDSKSHRSKDSSRDGRDRGRHESLKSDRDRNHRDVKHVDSKSSWADAEKDSRRSGDEKISDSLGEIERRISHKNRERETVLSQKPESEQHTNSKDSEVDGRRQHSSRSRDMSRRGESDRTVESDKRHSEQHHSSSSARQRSPDGRHRSSHTVDKKPEWYSTFQYINFLLLNSACLSCNYGRPLSVRRASMLYFANVFFYLFFFMAALFSGPG